MRRACAAALLPPFMVAAGALACEAAADAEGSIGTVEGEGKRPRDGKRDASSDFFLEAGGGKKKREKVSGGKRLDFFHLQLERALARGPLSFSFPPFLRPHPHFCPTRLANSSCNLPRSYRYSNVLEKRRERECRGPFRTINRAATAAKSSTPTNQSTYTHGATGRPTSGSRIRRDLPSRCAGGKGKEGGGKRAGN